jgi:hypothetical protein
MKSDGHDDGVHGMNWSIICGKDHGITGMVVQIFAISCDFFLTYAVKLIRDDVNKDWSLEKFR